jgi:dihydroorotase
MTSTIINGMVLVEGTLQAKNIVVEKGKIAEIGEGRRGDIIDASEKIVLPGLIDVHVHCRQPGAERKEDFFSASRAAAAGGVTTILDMPNTSPPTTTIAQLETKRALAASSVVNWGLYMGATDGNVDEVRKARNIAGVKIYMGSTTGDLVVKDASAIREFLESGKTIVVHAEDEKLMQKNAEAYNESHDAAVHALIRSPEVAAAAVRSALALAEHSKGLRRLHVTHASTAGEMKLIAAAKKKLPVSCDVTPHHLFLTSVELTKQGNYARMNPALRGVTDVQAVWQGVIDGTVDCIATDHAPHTREEKEVDYWKAPSGVPGLETMLPLLLDVVNKGKLTLEKVSSLTSANPARLFGISGKGKIALGYDADIVIVDMNLRKEVKNEEMFTKCGWSPFNKWELQGWPVMTIVGGDIVFDGKIHDVKGREVEFNE